MKKLLVLFSLALLIIVMGVSAEVETLPPQKQNVCFDIPQTCSNCTFVNVTSIKYPSPNSTTVYPSIGMTKNGFNYNYTFCDTVLLGDYIVSTCGNPDGILTCVDFDFPVTPSGANPISSGQGSILIIAMVVILLLSTVFFAMGLKFQSIAARSIFISLGFIMVLILVLYTLLILNESVAQSPTLVQGFETFYFVLRILAGIGVLTLIIVTVLVLIRAWKIKRGFID